MPDYRQRPRRIHGRHLYVACKPPARALRGHRTGRAAHDDDRRGEFPGLPRRGQRPADDGRHAAPGRALRRRDPHGHRHARRPLVAAVPRGDRRPDGDQGRNPDHRHGRLGQIPGAPLGDEIPRHGRERLRHLRRLLLPQKGRSRGRRRRHRLRGGHLPRLDLPQGLHDRAQTAPRRRCSSGCSAPPTSR